MGGGAAGADSGFGVPTQGPSGFRGLVENKKALALACFASLGGVLYGYNQGVFAQVQVEANFKARYNDTLGDSFLRGFLTSILELGAFVGAMIAGPVSDRFSRKYSISGWCVVFILGTCLQAAAGRSVDYIWAGRWIAGMGVGALSMLVPMYNGELAPPGIRGSLVALQQLAITLGILISYWIAFGTSYIGGEGGSQAAWRIPLALQLVPAVVLLVGAFFLPFSPRWLMLRGREEECLLCLSNLRDAEPESVLVQSEYLGLVAERLVQEEEKNERYGAGHSEFYYARKDYWRMFSNFKLFRRLFLGASAQFTQQFSGINAIIYYAPYVFESVGLTGSTIPILATGVGASQSLFGIVNFLFTFPAVLYVDKFGRKPILFFGSLSLAICLAIVGALVKTYGPDWDNKNAGNAAVFFLYLYIAIFACTWGPLAWVVSAEVFPLSVRGKGMAISSGTNWLANFGVATFTPPALDNIGYGTYLIFMGFMIWGCFWSYFLLPELKGKTLEEIDNFFRDNTGAEDAKRRERIAKQVGLDKLPVQEVEHQEQVSHAPANRIITGEKAA